MTGIPFIDPATPKPIRDELVADVLYKTGQQGMLATSAQIGVLLNDFAQLPATRGDRTELVWTRADIGDDLLVLADDGTHPQHPGLADLPDAVGHEAAAALIDTWMAGVAARRLDLDSKVMFHFSVPANRIWLVVPALP